MSRYDPDPMFNDPPTQPTTGHDGKLTVLSILVLLAFGVYLYSIA